MSSSSDKSDLPLDTVGTGEFEDIPDRSWVLVTGSNSGIGEATVLELSNRGYNILAGVRQERNLSHFDILNSDNVETSNETSNQIGLIETVLLDVTNPDHLNDLGSHPYFDSISAVIHNAAMFDVGKILDMEDYRIQHLFDTNVFAIISLSRILTTVLRKNHGRIILVSSDAGYANFPDHTTYCMTKHAIEALGEGLREELQMIPDGEGFGESSNKEEFHKIYVSIVSPGNIATPIFDKAIKQYSTSGSRVDDLNRYKAEEAEFRKARSPSVVAEVISRALSDPKPLLRYPVMEEDELRYVIRHNIEKLVALNRDNAYSLDRDELIAMLDFAYDL